ncbi:MAG: ribosome small subunit-dependent GTPase A [Chlorobiaceae bacterium]|nr:ribosome small subunit-dependent GTPase A [Chlorobiaceae bacterium]NTV60081.1 ribosome small subunit-dependent GTPase A [Chlorobiaceae bacterium]
MKLSDLGFDRWIEVFADDIPPGDRNIARVSAVDRNSFLVRNENTEVPAELSGKFLFTADSPVDLPCVGDWVEVQYHNGGASAIIQAVFPRRTFLRRKRAGMQVDYQMIAANIDMAFIIQSCHFDFNLPRLDRYLAMVADSHAEAVVILAKTDMVTPDDLQRKLDYIRESGITARVIALSNITGTGYDEFRQLLLPGRTYCLLGSSGVGKTTLLNRLIGRDDLDTKAVSSTGEGTHTTTRRQLILLENGVLFIDTPGMRELGLLGAGEGIEKGFEDIAELSTTCRYADCTHTGESGCAVLAAVADGELAGERYSSYMKLRKESEFHEMSYLEKRKKDRAFGRFVKKAKKDMKRW